MKALSPIIISTYYTLSLLRAHISPEKVRATSRYLLASRYLAPFATVIYPGDTRTRAMPLENVGLIGGALNHP